MTMLDRMRRHKNWLKWSLAIVVVAFVLLYIPNFLRNGIGGSVATGTRDVVASVEGQTITVGQFRRIYQQQMQAYRRAYGGNIDDRLLKQMGIDRRILQQLIDEEAALAEAHRLGISTSDEEVRARILALPAFQENGQFIGDTRYRQLLQMSDPPPPALGVRGRSPPKPDARQAAGRADGLDDGVGGRGHGGIQETQRESEARRRLVPCRQVPD